MLRALAFHSRRWDKCHAKQFEVLGRCWVRTMMRRDCGIARTTRNKSRFPHHTGREFANFPAPCGTNSKFPYRTRPAVKRRIYIGGMPTASLGVTTKKVCRAESKIILKKDIFPAGQLCRRSLNSSAIHSNYSGELRTLPFKLNDFLPRGRRAGYGRNRVLPESASFFPKMVFI